MNWTLYHGDDCHKVERFPDFRSAKRAIQEVRYESDFHILIGRVATDLVPYSRKMRIFNRQCQMIGEFTTWPLGTEVDLAKQLLEDGTVC